MHHPFFVFFFFFENNNIVLQISIECSRAYVKNWNHYAKKLTQTTFVHSKKGVTIRQEVFVDGTKKLFSSATSRVINRNRLMNEKLLSQLQVFLYFIKNMNKQHMRC